MVLISAAMNDPWDVKSVRLGNQYSSCMKINGVPLLPPVLSKECRKEMQYYKLLAKEVEKRISILQPYIESDCDSNADKTDAPDITECEDPQYVSPLEEKLEATIDFIVDKFSAREKKKEKSHPLSTDRYNANHSEVVIDLNVQIAGDRGVYTTIRKSPRHSPVPDEIPERDCDYYKKNKKQKELLNDIEIDRERTQKELVDSIMDYELDLLSDKGDYLLKDGPSSLSSKSFTGSLNDLHADISKQSQGSKLIRQRSYTVLNPSPQLLAHLEVQSMNTGVELNSISMSESMSKLSCSAKKRKSWDLESAKVKWSSMAMELKKKNIAAKSIASSNDKNKNAKSNSFKQDRRLQSNPNVRAQKSEPIEKSRHVQNSVTNKNVSNGKGIARETSSSTNTVVAKSSPKPVGPKKEDMNKTVALISESDDPAVRVRELYEKLQKQQLMQMANLMEKQKREQHLLQQVFEEQNSILLKQLKTVCPEGSIKVKQAWGELKNEDEIDRGPVSLSQLINTSTPDHSIPNSPVSKTLTETNSCLNKCDSMLKRSRDITNSIRKQTTNVQTANGGRGQRFIDEAPTAHSQANSVMTKSRSPCRNTSRRLIYEATASSDAETILTDRTNDTMADLNVTFPSDNSDSYSQSNRKIYATRACSPLSPRMNSPRKSVEGGSNNLEKSMTSTNSVGSRSVTKHSILYRQPNAQELVAATKIVACAKGFLVRRLMRTERVQTTVQTIKDALLCALQLHQDREGIRGADVDLHRRLIQQITAACYSLHDTFVSSSSTERCSMIAADRVRRQTLVNKPPSSRNSMRGDAMSQSYSGAFPSRIKRPSSAGLMTQSNYETFEKPRSRYNRYMPTQRKVPWR